MGFPLSPSATTASGINHRPYSVFTNRKLNFKHITKNEITEKRRKKKEKVLRERTKKQR